MPLLSSDPLLDNVTLGDPASTRYTFPLASRNISQITKDLHFQTVYDPQEYLPLEWVRNLRHWPHSMLDAVSGESPHHLARKRITTSDFDQGSMLAIREAEILRSVHHRHVVQLYSTWRQADLYTLLYDPAADYDLRTYIEMAELGVRPRESTRLLTECFGCLANVLSHVHKAGYDHGDIRPENVLIHDGNILFSKFSLGLKIENADSPVDERWVNRFGKLITGRPSSSPSSSNTDGGSLRSTDPAAVSDSHTRRICHANKLRKGYYKPPEWQPEQGEYFGQPKADIFALGCMFLEIYTVQQGKRLSAFRNCRIDEKGSDYRHNISNAVQWLNNLEGRQYASKDRFHNLLKLMISEQPAERPSAQDVHEKSRQCRTFDGVNRCGSTCCLK